MDSIEAVGLKNLGEAFQIVKTSLGALVALVMIAYFTRDHRYSRLTLLLWAGLTPCLVFSGRLVLRLVLSQLRRYGLNLRHIVVVGDGDSAKSVVDTILADSSLGLNIVGHVGDKPAHPEVPYLGTFDVLPEVVQSHAPQQWILTLRPEKMPLLPKLVEVMQSTDADIRLIPDIIQYATLGRGLRTSLAFLVSICSRVLRVDSTSC